MNLGQLFLERLTQPIGQHRVGRLWIRHHLHNVLARQLLGQKLIQTSGHRQDVDTARSSQRGHRRQREKKREGNAFHYNHSLQAMADLSITAVIPVHNRADLLARLLATLEAQTVPFAEVLVVDNASTDHAAQVAREAGCRVIEMGENPGLRPRRQSRLARRRRSLDRYPEQRRGTG